MSSVQILVIIGVITGGTMLTRFLPYLIFPASRKTPEFVMYLGKVLPYAVIGMLVVFCLKDVNFTAAAHYAPEAIAILCIVLLHLWKSNVLLSVGGGTLIYMVLVQLVFV